ncbi:hypothetical protein PoB_001811300 [Plakobranchus ocellatus]|uniref:Uncharacterized protein n=1 Tax=Plakobranchus ocellatus TaxID=259542 RepID=A0AAV3ZA18_9GAST|nr:hypothetical protein PoB_001811300 [Plakobranchus ocellatus]
MRTQRNRKKYRSFELIAPSVSVYFPSVAIPPLQITTIETGPHKFVYCCTERDSQTSYTGGHVDPSGWYGDHGDIFGELADKVCITSPLLDHTKSMLVACLGWT